MKKILLLFFIIFLSACTTSENYAPVVEISTIQPLPKSGKHIVAYQETLYSIAWIYGLDYRDIAKKNHLLPPYSVHEDQVIYLPAKKSVITPKKELPEIAIVKKPMQESRATTKTTPFIEPTGSVKLWRNPANGPIISRFGAQNKGINIGGNMGDPIFATANGKVVYSGNGLRGYGNLIIIKHNSTYLSAYAHNRRVFVRDGDTVQGGQKIAEMGDSGTTRVMLHFEIRRNGQPVNPAIYLK